MPELPDIEVYVARLRAKTLDKSLEKVTIAKPFLVRTVEPRVTEMVGKRVVGIERLGKRIVFEFEGDLFMVIHLMVAGRLRWKKRGAKPPGRIGQATFEFPDGTLVFTEAGKKRRASLHLVAGRENLVAFDRGGMELHTGVLSDFKDRLQRENHTLKRSLTDPRLFSGIGGAFSDEIMHRAHVSPIKWTSKLTDDEIATLFDCTKAVLSEWTERLMTEVGEGFPDKVTAFRPEMAVHGKYKEPCPVCQTPVQRIRYADNETNYCPLCQTNGKILADRSLSRLLKKDWPRSIDELG